MVHSSKEEKDLYITTMITNIANDKKCFNIENKKRFTSHHETSSYLREELEEAEEEVKKLRTDFEMYWFYCKNERKCAHSDFSKQLELMADRCKNSINELFDTYAVILKAIDQGKEWEE